MGRYQFLNQYDKNDTGNNGDMDKIGDIFYLPRDDTQNAAILQ